MNEKAIKTLEFDKILAMLAQHASNEITLNRIKTLKPSDDLEEVKHELSLVNEAFYLIVKKQYPYTADFKDVSGAVKRAEIGGCLNTTELINIGNVFRIARSLISFYKDDNREEALLDSLFGMLIPDKNTEKAIFDVIKDENEIADNASPALLSIRRQIASAHSGIRETLNKLTHGQAHKKHLQESIVTSRNGRYVVPVKAEYRSEISGIVHDMSSSGATVFIEPNAVVEANNKLRELAVKEEAEISRILAELTAMVAEVRDEIITNQKAISDIDFIFAKAQLAVSMNAVAPNVNDRGMINIISGRHPLLDQRTVVPISLRLGGDIRSMVITGPNTGGKTVTLKTVGLMSMMTAAGMMIPVSSGSEISIFDEIYSDIGDEQSIEQSLSTFSAHMTNIIDIIKNVNGRSLVLYDELGAGTDPVEGAALAVAILEYTRNMGAVTMATTHYSELKLYALTTKGVENVGCEFDVNSLKPTYRLIVGTPGKSNAFAISKKLGLPDSIIDKAGSLLSEDTVKFEDVLENLEKSRQIAETEREAAERYRLEAESLKKQLSMDKERISEQKEKLLLSAKQEAKRIIQNAKAEVDQVISEIKEAQKEQDRKKANSAVEGARKKLRSLDAPVIRQNTDNSLPPKTVIPGNTVKLVDIDQTGIVLTKPDKNGNVNVQVGIMKIASSLDNLRLVSDNKAKKPDKYITNRKSGLNLSTAKTELDLRGYTLDEALLLTDRFIDEGVIASFNQITVIHGKGTGTLRAGIHKMLKTHPSVRDYRLGTYGEGESGVTIITLKD